MESPNAVAGNKAPSSVLGKNSEVNGGLFAALGGSRIQGLNHEVNSLNSNNENPYAVLGTSRDYPKLVDLDESNLEVNSSKAKDHETPVIVLDPVNESSEGGNIDEPNLQVKPPHTHTGEIPSLVQDPSQDSCQGKNLDESNVEVPPIEPGPTASEVANAEHDDEEYACKYCHRKFSNKQSLGGHQNAHKFERAMEKDASETQESRAGYFSGTSSYPKMASPLSSHPGSLKRSYEYVNRPLQISKPYQSQQMLQHQGMHVARPMLPIVQPQAVPHHFHEFSRGYHPAGWTVPPLKPRISNVVPTVPVPRVSQFVMAQPPYLPSLGLTLQFPNQGAESSSSRPVSQGLSASHESRSVPGRNAGVQNNNQMKIVPGSEEDDSGLDLTLRL